MKARGATASAPIILPRLVIISFLSSFLSSLLANSSSISMLTPSAIFMLAFRHSSYGGTRLGAATP